MDSLKFDIAISPVGTGTDVKHAPIDFYSIDWVKTFGMMDWSYSGVRYERFQKFIRKDGTLDPAIFEEGNIGHGSRELTQKYMCTDGKADVDKIVRYLEEFTGAIGSQFLPLAVPNPAALPLEDQERIRTAILKRTQNLVLRGLLSEAFEVLETIFPAWFDGFELLDASLPLAMQSRYRDKASACINIYDANHIVIDDTLPQDSITATLVSRKIVEDVSTARALEASIREHALGIRNMMNFICRMPSRLPLLRDNASRIEQSEDPKRLS